MLKTPDADRSVASILQRNTNLFNLEPSLPEFQTKLNVWTESIKGRLLNLRGEANTKPIVSVVVPAMDEEKYILQLLESLARQKTDLQVEVIVVANNCSPDDKTAAIARASGVVVIEYSSPNLKTPQISWARQRGLERAQGKIIVSTDADVIASPKWLETLTKPLLLDAGVSMTTGDVQHYGGGLVMKVHDTFTRFTRRSIRAMGKYGVKSRYSNAIGVGQNMAFRKSDALEVGGYNMKTFREDTFLGLALTKVGRPMLITSPDAKTWASARRFKNESYLNALKNRLQIRGGDRFYYDKNGNFKNYR